MSEGKNAEQYEGKSVKGSYSKGRGSLSEEVVCDLRSELSGSPTTRDTKACLTRSLLGWGNFNLRPFLCAAERKQELWG